MQTIKLQNIFTAIAATAIVLVGFALFTQTAMAAEIQATTTQTTIAETGESTEITVTLSSDPGADVTIEITQSSGDASAGDYTLTESSGTADDGTITLTSANYNSGVVVTVTATDDSTVENDETATLTFNDAAENQTSAVIQITINDNDFGTPVITNLNPVSNGTLELYQFHGDTFFKLEATVTTEGGGVIPDHLDVKFVVNAGHGSIAYGFSESDESDTNVAWGSGIEGLKTTIDIQAGDLITFQVNVVDTKGTADGDDDTTIATKEATHVMYGSAPDSSSGGGGILTPVNSSVDSSDGDSSDGDEDETTELDINGDGNQDILIAGDVSLSEMTDQEMISALTAAVTSLTETYINLDSETQALVSDEMSAILSMTIGILQKTSATDYNSTRSNRNAG